MSGPLTLKDPVATDSYNDHADYMEALAVTSPDSGSSYQDFVSAIRRAGTLDAVTERLSPDPASEKSQELADTAFAELDRRSRACAGSYPFELSDQSLRLSSLDAVNTPYVFMLLLKLFGVGAGPRGIKGASHFEELSSVAAQRYLGGPEQGVQSYHFGFPRRLSPGGFKDALDDLCKHLGEGEGAKNRPALRKQKDAKLDLVSWRPFPDGRSAKLVFFGQCSAGDRWDGKVLELHPLQFQRMWIQGHLSYVPGVLFFVPRCLDDEEWDSIAAVGNIVPMDRCRISYLLSAAPLPEDLQKRTVKWISHVRQRAGEHA